jgi:hypothetical protein
MTAKHLSSFQLDSLAQATLTEAERPMAAQHLEACAECRAELESARSLRERFSREVFARTVPRIRTASGWSLPWPTKNWLLPALAGAFVVAAVLIVPLRSMLEPAFSVKGDPTLRVFVHRGDRVFQVKESDALQPGDQVRFEVMPAGYPYLLIASVDGAGHANIYLPFGGRESAEISPERALMSPGSIVLDATPGPERVFVLLSKRPLPAAEVASVLETIGRGGATSIRRGGDISVGADAQVSFVWEKSAP